MKIAFVKKYVTQHIKDYKIMYLSLLVAIIYVTCFIECQSNIHRIIEGICLSIFAAYLFFLFITVIPDFFNTKKALTISEENFRLIVIEAFDVFGILSVFSAKNYQDLQIPNNIQYMKYDNGQTFFNPREELKSKLNIIEHNIYEIHTGHLVLPIKLLEDLNVIQKKCKELSDYLNSSYICTDDNLSVDKIGKKDLSDIIKELRYSVDNIKSYFMFDIKQRLYYLMSELEIKKYNKMRADTMLSLPPNKRGNRVYKGGTRIE